jgi:hypothetical protein
MVTAKGRPPVSLSILAVGMFILFLPITVLAGWSSPWTTGKVLKSGAMPPQEDAASEDTSGAERSAAVQESLTAPGLFWFECGPADDCTNASLWYVDPAAVKPVPTKLDSGIFISDNEEAHRIYTGSVNTSTYQLTGLATAYIVYFKGGSIWRVDTTTLNKTQLSNETGITPDKLCGFDSVQNWLNPAQSVVSYRLLVSGSCQTGSQAGRAVRLNMSPTTAPIDTGYRGLVQVLFDGRYLLVDWTSSPSAVKVCSSSLTSCTNVTTFSNESHFPDYDANRFTMILDGKLMAYNYTTPALKTLYTPAASQIIGSSRLDRDGYVYFSTIDQSSPYAHSIKKVPVAGGAVITLASFSTAYFLPFLDVEISPNYLVYTYPNSTYASATVRSVAKNGGAPVTLESAYVNGGVGGDYFFSETASGQVKRINLNGGTAVTRSNTQLTGVTFGGTADWHYNINMSTARLFATSSSGVVKSYACTEDLSSSAAGIVMGTVPVNLVNFGINGIDSAVLGHGRKRDQDLSYGKDVLFLNSLTPSSLKRLTNSNGRKGILSQKD